MESIAAVGLPDVSMTAGRTSWHRAAGRVAARGEHEAAGTAVRHYNSESYIEARWRRAAGRAAARGEHRGSGYCLSSLRRRVAHRGITPPGGRQRVESIEAVDTACHPFDGGSHIHRAARSGGRAWRALRQWVLPVVTTIGQRVVHRGIAPSGWLQRVEIEAVVTACHSYEPTTAGRTSRHRAAGHAAARGEHRGSGY